jgi:simple sugar transport system ATP-binding protein
MVHQHFMLVPRLTVVENVVLGLPAPRLLLDLPRAAARLAELGERLGLRVDPAARIADLSVGECQRVEILKVLYRGARILLLDEPTAVLAPGEVEELFDALRQMAADGRSIVLISHKLDEVLSIADRCTVLHRGRCTAVGRPTHGTRAADVARWMMGGEEDPATSAGDAGPRVAPVRAGAGPAALELAGATATRDDGTPALRDLSLRVAPGEVLGVAGVSGNGQAELAEVIAGLRSLTAGAIRFFGEDVGHQPVAGRLDLGLAYVPEDRGGVGSAADLSLVDNLALRSHRHPPVRRGPWLRWPEARAAALRCLRDHDVVHAHPSQAAGQLSGGNLQKLILGRELAEGPKILVAAQPSRGLDLAATAAVDRHVRAESARGTAVLLISEDLDELERLADRIVVLYAGRVAGETVGGSLDRQLVGRWMTGAAGVAT